MRREWQRLVEEQYKATNKPTKLKSVLRKSDELSAEQRSLTNRVVLLCSREYKRRKLDKVEQYFRSFRRRAEALIRHRIANRVLCPRCAEVKSIIEVHSDSSFTLECSHVRPVILPKPQGSLSIEDAYAAEGMRAFPVQWDEERSTSSHFQEWEQ